MAEVDEVKSGGEAQLPTSKIRAVTMLGRSASFGILAAVIGLGWQGGATAAGAFGGALAAGLYATGYLNSHLSRAVRQRLWDSGLAATAALRLLALAGGGVAAYLAGKAVLISYLTSFAAIFALLVGMEIARVAAVCRSRGEVGAR